MIASHVLALKRPARHPSTLAAATTVALVCGLSLVLVATGGPARAAAPNILLGAAEDYAVLAGAGVTNTGTTTITTTTNPQLNGNVGTSPGGTIDGGISWVLPAAGTTHVNDADSGGAQAANLTAYGTAVAAPSDAALGGQLDGALLKPGVYTASSALDLAVNGTLTLDADGDPNAVFVIQVGSSLTLNSGSTVSLIDGAAPCRVFWQVSDDATIGSNATFVGTLLAENAIVAQTNATIEGRLLAQNAAVSLDSNTFTMPTCTPRPTTPTTATPAPTVSPTKAKPTPKKTTPSKKSGSGKGKDSDKDSDKGGSSDGSRGGSGGSGSGTNAGGADGAADSDADGTTSTSTGIPNTGGPPLFLAPVGAVVLLAGAGLVVASRRRRPGAHRS